MKISIKYKLLAVMLVLSVVPLGILGMISLQDSNNLSKEIAGEARSIGEISIEESTDALAALGAELMKVKAEDVAKQVEIYIKEHPDMTIADLRNDTEFRSIVVQDVGETGFTTGMDADTLVIQFHRNTADEGIDLHDKKDTNPEYYKLLQSGWGYIDTSGYYTWTDENGDVRDKYGYFVVAQAPTADNVFLRIGATVYTDEFSEPSKQTEEKIQEKLDEAEGKISMKTSEMSTQNTVLIITILTILIVTAISFVFAASITKPLHRLRDVADRVSMGDMEDTEIEITNEDEIGDLAESFRRMIVSMKYYMSKANRDSDRDEE